MVRLRFVEMEHIATALIEKALVLIIKVCVCGINKNLAQSEIL